MLPILLSNVGIPTAELLLSSAFGGGGTSPRPRPHAYPCLNPRVPSGIRGSPGGAVHTGLSLLGDPSCGDDDDAPELDDSTMGDSAAPVVSCPRKPPSAEVAAACDASAFVDRVCLTVALIIIEAPEGPDTPPGITPPPARGVVAPPGSYAARAGISSGDIDAPVLLPTPKGIPPETLAPSAAFANAKLQSGCSEAKEVESSCADMVPPGPGLGLSSHGSAMTRMR